MNRPKVLLTAKRSLIPRGGIDLLAEKCDLISVSKNESLEEILSKIPGVDGLFWTTRVRLTKQVLDAAGPQLKAIGTMSAGLDHIDVEEIKRRGIKLGSCAQVGDNSVADLAVVLALAAARRLHEGRVNVEIGNWINNQCMFGQDIEGSTVGIIGLGGIGRAIIKRLQHFEVNRFLYTGRTQKKDGDELGAKFVTLHDLLQQSDFVFVSCPLSPETQGLCNKSFFKTMKNTAVFVNIGRGQIMVQDDLIEALRENEIFAAGLDVTDPEPLPIDSELLSLPNCVLMPHIGCATNNTRLKQSVVTARNILLGLEGKEMVAPVV